MIMTTRNAPARILTNDDIRRVAPSAFATQPWDRMSHRYKLVPTIEVVGMLADKGFRPVLAKQSRTRIEGKGDFTKHLIRFRHDDQMHSQMLDTELPELVLTNSHDGTSAYKFHAGIFRTVCLNGLTVQSADFGSIKVNHSGGNDFEQKIIDATYEVIDQAPKSLAQVEAWKQVKLTDDQRWAFAEAALAVKDSSIEVKPGAALRTRRVADMASDLWTTANVVQENLIRGGIRGVGSNGQQTTVREVKSVNEDLRLNKALWTLTARMAELLG